MANYTVTHNYNGEPLTCLVDHAGDIQMVVVGETGGVKGFYYG
jgi:hypothetical protein